MIVSYNKAFTSGGSTLVALMVAGAAFLSLGLGGGHVWQVITGGALLGVGAAVGVAFLLIMELPRNEKKAQEAFNKDKRTLIWTLISHKGKTRILQKGAGAFGNIKVRGKNEHSPFEKWTRVIILAP